MTQSLNGTEAGSYHWSFSETVSKLGYPCLDLTTQSTEPSGLVSMRMWSHGAFWLTNIMSSSSQQSSGLIIYPPSLLNAKPEVSQVPITELEIPGLSLEFVSSDSKF